MSSSFNADLLSITDVLQSQDDKIERIQKIVTENNTNVGQRIDEVKNVLSQIQERLCNIESLQANPSHRSPSVPQAIVNPVYKDEEENTGGTSQANGKLFYKIF